MAALGAFETLAPALQLQHAEALARCLVDKDSDVRQTAAMVSQELFETQGVNAIAAPSRLAFLRCAAEGGAVGLFKTLLEEGVLPSAGSALTR